MTYASQPATGGGALFCGKLEFAGVLGVSWRNSPMSGLFAAGRFCGAGAAQSVCFSAASCANRTAASYFWASSAPLQEPPSHTQSG